MPDSGPYSLLILSFAIFSFVSWQVKREDVAVSPGLAFGAAIVMVFAAARLVIELVGSALAGEPSGSPYLAAADIMLGVSFLVLIARTATHVLLIAITGDPTK